MIQYVIPLVSSYFSTGFTSFWLWPVLGLCFLATVPCIIRSIIRWR